MKMYYSMICFYLTWIKNDLVQSSALSPDFLINHASDRDTQGWLEIYFVSITLNAHCPQGVTGEAVLVSVSPTVITFMTKATCGGKGLLHLPAASLSLREVRAEM